MNYYRMVGEGGFKWGMHMYPGRVIKTSLSPEEAPRYFEPATALDYVNFRRKRNGERPLRSLTSGDEVGGDSDFWYLAAGGSPQRRAEQRKRAVNYTLADLDHDNPDHWTESGEPRVDVVTELLFERGSWAITSEEIQSLAPDFRRHHGVVPWH